MKILRLSVIAGTYNYGEPVFGDNMSKEEAEQTVEELKGLGSVSALWLGLAEQEQAVQLRYRIVGASLQKMNSARDCGLIIVECEADLI